MQPTYAYLLVGHGSVCGLTASDGNLTDRYSYNAYGNLILQRGTTENDFLYTGEQYNAGTGLYYLRARYMSPSTGTFITMDSYAGTLNDPVSLHKYLYANANPVMYTDPSGYSPLANQLVAMTAYDIQQCASFVALNTLMGTIAGAAIGAIDSALGGNNGKQILADALQGAKWGAGLGFVISTIMCFAVQYPIFITILQVIQVGLLIYGGYGVCVSIAEGNVAQAIFRGMLLLFSIKGYVDSVEGFRLVRANKNGGTLSNRNLQDTSELNVNDILNLKNNGVVKVNSSGSNRPLTGAPNSYYKTGNGEHIFVYDNSGKLIYDISSSRIKAFKINVDPNGVEHYQAYKLIGAVPNAIKKFFGW